MIPAAHDLPINPMILVQIVEFVDLQTVGIWSKEWARSAQPYTVGLPSVDLWFSIFMYHLSAIGFYCFFPRFLQLFCHAFTYLYVHFDLMS